MTTVRWKYIWPYLVFGSTITLAVVVNVNFIIEGIEHSKQFARVINTAGRQRYLSQANLTNLLQLSHNTSVKARLRRDLILWNNTHQSLQTENNEVSGNGIPSPFHEINPIQQRLFATMQAAVNSNNTPSVASQAAYLQSLYLPEMDKVVFHYEQRSQEALAEIREKQILAAAISGLVLILEMLLLVIPYHRKLILAFRELKKNKVLIEEQGEEIQQQLDTVSLQNAQLEKLLQSEELTLSGINAGVWNWDIITGQENWSPNFYTLLGYELGEIPATYDCFINFLLHPDDKQVVEEAVRLHLEASKKYQVNVRMLTKSDGYRWYDAAGKAARNADGIPIQMAGSIIDINDKIIYQKKIETANFSKDKIFAILSHDLKSPLAAIKGLLELQAIGELTQKEFEEYVEHMKDGVGFALRTLDNVLVWASTQMDIIKVHATTFKIEDVFVEVEQFHRYFALQKSITITYTAPQYILAYADTNHVFIITRNMVGNAIKFTPQGGKIDVTATVAGNHMQVTVRDNGIGIDQKSINQLLSKQEHLSTYGTNGEKGTGLGINLILELLELNHGKLTVQSEPGKGSSFSYTIPLGNTGNQ